MSEEVEVVPLRAVHLDRAVDAVARAFLDDPMWSCVLPDRGVRDVALRPMWRALVGFARVYGEALTTPGGEGAACWIRPGKTRTTLWMVLRTGLGLPRAIVRLPRDARERFFTMMRFIDERHRLVMSGPHWYLWVLGVAPEVQRRGIGRALLRPILDRADATGVSCYLETQTEGNVAFYRECGFDVIDEQNEPVCGLPIWFMRRIARSLEQGSETATDRSSARSCVRRGVRG